MSYTLFLFLAVHNNIAIFALLWHSSYLVWVGIKLCNAKEEKLLINDASLICSKKFDFSIE